MLGYLGLDEELTIVFFSSLLAAISFAAFAYPFLERSDKKERYKAIIEKRRKDLFAAAKTPSKQSEFTSAKENLTSFYKMQKLAGQMGERVRDKLLQAGIRSPSAPLKYILAQALLPVLFCGFAMLILSQSEKEVHNGVVVLIMLTAAFAGFKLPAVLVKNQALKRQEEINIAFPDALDMMLICVQGGIGLEQTVDRVALEIADHSEVLAEELGILSAEMAMLNDRRGALQDFARRVGSGAAKSFATALIQAEQYGTSVSQAMRVMSEELRDIRMANAEQKAASLPPKLTVPMILFFLPALFIVILGPAGIQASEAGLGS